MRRANIPLNPPRAGSGRGSTGGQGSPSPASAPGAGAPTQLPPVLQFLAGTTPGDFPFLSDPEARNPEANPSDQRDSPLQALAKSSQSAFGMAVLSRLARR